MRCAVNFEEMVQGRKSPTLLLLATTETQERVESSKEVAGMMTGAGQKERRRWALKEISGLLSKQCLAKRLSFLEDVCGETGLMIEDLYLVLIVKPLHNLHLKVPELFKSCFIQYSTS